MSLDRSPSRERGGWSSPGLTTPYEEANGNSYGDMNGRHGVTWAKARASSARVQGSQSQGFLSRHYRNISESLPYFAHGGQEDRFAEKEKLGRGRSGRMSLKELPRRLGLLLSRRRRPVAGFLLMVVILLMWFSKRTYMPKWLGARAQADPHQL